MVTSTDLLGGNTKILPEGSNSCAVFAPLRICKSTGTVGGTNDTLLMKYLGSELKVMLRFTLMSAPPEKCFPGAPGFWSGDKLVSFNGLTLVVWFVVGSAMRAPAYRKMAEFSAFVNPVVPLLGFALIQ